MIIIDADKFLAYLIYSKHIDGLTCGEVKKAIEMCKVDVLDKIRAEIAEYKDDKIIHLERNEMIDIVLDIIDKYKVESEEISDRNLKMWHDIYAEEKRRGGSE